MHYMEALMLITTAEYVAPTSDENVTVTDTEFSNVAVRLFVPRRAPDGLRRAVIYFHGGGWCVGHAGERFGRRREDLKVLRTAFCFVGAATKEGQGTGISPVKTRWRCWKLPESFCKEE